MCVYGLWETGGPDMRTRSPKTNGFGDFVERENETGRVSRREMRQDGRVDNSPGMEGNLGLANGGANKNCTAGFCVEHCQQTERVPST